MQGQEQVLEEIRRRIETFNPEVFIVDMALKQSKGTVLSILLDTDQGVTIDECARISRKLNQYIEEESGIDFPFTLEVSSPGVGKPFKVRRQYFKNVGRKLRVRMTDELIHKGKLVQADESGITLQLKPPKKGKAGKTTPDDTGETITIPYDQIKEAVVEISFD